MHPTVAAEPRDRAARGAPAARQGWPLHPPVVQTSEREPPPREDLDRQTLFGRELSASLGDTEKGIDEAFFGKNPIKPHSFAFEIAAYDANSRPTLMDKHVQARVEAEALELENKIVQSGGNLSDTTLVFCADTYSVEKSLQDIAEYVERDT